MNHSTQNAGFTLIELLIVVGIIIVLAAVGAVSYSAISTGARASETRSTLAELVTIATEYEALTGRVINHIPESANYQPVQPPNLAKFDWERSEGFEHNYVPPLSNQFSGNVERGSLDANGRPEFARIAGRRFAWAAWQAPATRTILEGMDALRTASDPPPYDRTAFYDLFDAWGTPIVYVSMSDPTDPYVEDDWFPVRDRPYFASAGPDGEFGDHRELVKRRNGQAHDHDAAQLAEDNLYSFELD